MLIMCTAAPACSWQCALSNNTFKSHQWCEGQVMRRDWGTRMAPHTYLTKSLLWHLMKCSPSVCACAVLSAQTVKWAGRWRLTFLSCFLSMWLWFRVQVPYLNFVSVTRIRESTQPPPVPPKIQPQSPFLLFKSAFTKYPWLLLPFIHPSFLSEPSLMSVVSSNRVLEICSLTRIKHAHNDYQCRIQTATAGGFFHAE